MAPRKRASAAAKPAASVAGPAAARGEIDASEVQLPPEGGFQQDGLFLFDARPVIAGWPASVTFPVTGGQQRRVEFRLDLEYLAPDEVRELDEAVADFLAGGGKPGGPGDPLHRKLRGWSGLGAEGKGVLEVNDANRVRLLADSRIRGAVNVALAKMAMGIEEKNSETPPAAGPAQRPGLNREARRRLARQVANGLKATG